MKHLSFNTLHEDAEFVYKCTDFYKPELEGSIAWNDPDIGIQWPLDSIDEVLLSDKDNNALMLKESQVVF
jgi:dTDP-4-dehydrorhamnose 3,5-epimerase